MTIEMLVPRLTTDELTTALDSFAYAFTQAERIFIRHAIDERHSIVNAIELLSTRDRWQEINGLSFTVTEDIPTGALS